MEVPGLWPGGCDHGGEPLARCWSEPWVDCSAAAASWHDERMSKKPLVLSDIRSRAATFVSQWRDAEGYERGEAQEFVRGLLQVFGISGRTAAVYEKRAQRASTGQRGYIDALISGTALIEMKSAGADLVAAETQALDYLESLTENEEPDFVITSDFKRFRVLSLVADSDKDSLLEFKLEDLPSHVEDLMFLAGYRRAKFGSKEQEAASIKAAQLMAGLYEHLEKTGYDEHQASVFLIRTLFCLYADDSGLWERDLFSRYLEERTSQDGSDLGSQLTALYQALNRPEGKRYGQDDDLIQAFPYVNGSVFGEPVDIPHFDRTSRDLLIQAAYFNWSSISPAIFGSLFQAVKDKQARRELGEHYTTETNILKLIRPLFLDDLEERLTKSWAKKRDLEALLDHLGSLTFMDPACGCGNFLIIAYRELRALELRIHERLQQLDPSRTQLSLDAAERVHVKLSQFYGIEIEEWPATIARTAMFLVEHQANQDVNLTLGYALPMLPLQDSAQIIIGNALRVKWDEIVPDQGRVFIFGNPPFVGYDQRTDAQKADIEHVWDTSRIGRLDYVTCWHRRSVEYYSSPLREGEFGFVSTNSITQGEPVPLLFDMLYVNGWSIRFAHRTFIWTSEAPDSASVHCNIIGFTRSRASSVKRRLFKYPDSDSRPIEYPAARINPYLVDAEDVIVRKRTNPLSGRIPKVTNGCVAGDTRRGEENLGGLVLSPDEAEKIRETDPIAASFLRPFVGGEDFLNGKIRYCIWMPEPDGDAIARSSELQRRFKNVRNVRMKSSEKSTVKLAEQPYRFKHIAQPDENYICIPRTVPDTRRFLAVGFLTPDVIVSNGSFWAVDSDGLVFAIASSSMFIAWQRAIGGRIKSDPRFANTLTWNTFPMPKVASSLYSEIAEAGKKVLSARESKPDLSLAQHYNPLSMSGELLKAHAALDRVVDKAFGARKTSPSEEERQELLFKRYADMIA